MPTKRKVLILSDINSIHTQKWIISLMYDYQILLFSIDPINELTKDIKLIQEQVEIKTSKQKLSGVKNKLLFISLFFELIKIKKSFNPHIIHSHYATSYGLLGRMLFFKNFYLSVWGSDIFDFPLKSVFHKWIMIFILKGADKIFSTSHVMAKEINIYTPKKVIIVPFGIDFKLFKPQEKKSNKNFVLGTVKSLEDVYGIDRLIDVFNIVQKSINNCSCVIYGSGTKEKVLKEKVSSLGLDSKVFFKGKIGNQDVSKALSDMDIFCAFSRSESFGVAVLEASSCGVPVVVTNVGGLPEVVLNNETGFVCNYNEKEISDKIIQLYHDKDLMLSLGENGARFVKSNFDWDKNVDLMKKHYNE